MLLALCAWAHSSVCGAGLYTFEAEAVNITTYTAADMCGGLASHAGCGRLCICWP